jgi:squalene-hopene/tetraprenyl-beta-curcumene cyclase
MTRRSRYWCYLRLVTIAAPQHEAVSQAINRGVNWVLGMQSANGGWAAFDRDNDKRMISAIPFCNFGEALDPPSVDVTGHVLEALGALGFTAQHPAVQRGLSFIYAEQEGDGSWFGRWGVNYIYGIAAVLPALRALESRHGYAEHSHCRPMAARAPEFRRRLG